ncbi:MAG: ABC transporter ATP-binding protein [Acidimicrobiia bacterium]|nr:ABC transporter ATP-binding protein [Acidimicrobiia bacterium]MBP8181154.1 ABC transporter ATP-binding protein [Acidimicrobiia bacterium]
MLGDLIRLLRIHMRKYRGLLLALIVFQLVGTIASLFLPSLNGRIIDDGVSQGDTDFIIRTGGIMLLVSLIQISASIVATWLASTASSGMALGVRKNLFHKVGSFSAQEVARFGAPTLISRTTNDVQQVQLVTNLMLAMTLSAPIMMVGGIAMAIREDPGLSWLVAVSVPLLAISVGILTRKMIPGFQTMQSSVDKVNRILREQITGIRVVRAFTRETAEETRFADANTTYTQSAVSVGNLMAMAFPIVMFIFNASTVAVLWFGARRVAGGDMEVGALSAFMSYLMQILMSVMMATFMSMMVPRAAVSATRLMQVLDTEPTVEEPPNPAALPKGPASVEFHNVTFTYPGADSPVLEDISFLAKPGQVTAIIGSTGAGKTTLIDLVPRLYDVKGGSVTIGGVDVRDADLNDLWQTIGLVPQRPFLFSGTIESNLRYGKPDATEAELWNALRIAQAQAFVEANPDGLQAPISQGGSNLSGGQRQRMAIARAVIRRPDIYIFDDAFSALDLQTDANLRAALQPITADSVVLIVAQRVSTIVEADQIVVLEDGRIVGKGTHDELLDTCPTYAEIVASQALTEVKAA